MSDTPQDPDAGAQEGGYGYPPLEQEVTREVLEGGAQSDEAGAGSDEAGAGSDEDDGTDDAPAPGELATEPTATEPTD